MPPIARMPSSTDVDTGNNSSNNNNNNLAEFLDNQADTAGLKNVSDSGEDWTDVKHSERKKRDRLLDDGVLIGLMKKSDLEGTKRLVTNLSIMAATIYSIYRLDVFPFNDDDESFTWDKMVLFIPLYFFYGFQFQAFAFAGQHEFLHRNAFRTKSINDWCLFYTGVFTFESGEHERVMHKQHHTYTNHIDKDPELVSYYDRETLENAGFRNIPLSRWGYIYQFLDVAYTFKCRMGRVFFSACGIPVDYSGTSWNLKEFSYGEDSGIMAKLQRTAILQILHWVAFFAIFGRTKEGLQGLFFWWIVPVLVGYPVVNFFRNLEHADCEVSKDPNCLRNTRSVKSNPIVRLLLWDTGFHCEHHCYPMVPFYNLHKLHDLMKDSMLHSEVDHFSLQNLQCVRPGGWIDGQARDMEADRISKMEKKSE